MLAEQQITFPSLRIGFAGLIPAQARNAVEEALADLASSTRLEASEPKAWPEIMVISFSTTEATVIRQELTLRRRQQAKDCGFLVLVPVANEDLCCEILAWGADDVVASDLSPREIGLRAKAIVRRLLGPRSDTVTQRSYGPITMNRDAYAIDIEGKAVELTPKEFRLLWLLLEQQGKTVRRRELTEIVWSGALGQDSRALDTHIKRLRFKLGSAGRLVETVRGVGYRLGSN